MVVRTPRARVVAAVIGLTACQGVTALDLATARDRVVDDACASFARCEAEWGRVFPDEATCAALAPAWLGLPPRDASRLAGFDRDRLARCLASLPAAACVSPPTAEEVSACLDRAAVGTLAEGDCCDHRGGCGLGLECAPTSSGLGRCLVPAGPLQSCADRPCLPSLACHGDALCRGPGTAGDPCDGDDHCQSGLICDPLAETCRGPGAVGAACALDAHCAEPLHCDAAQLCAAALPLDAACDRDRQCGATAACDGTCVALATLGASCAAQACAPALYCDGAGECAPLPVAGESCAESGVCLDALCEPSWDWMCRGWPSGPPRVGLECGVSGDCPVGADCIFAAGQGACEAHGGHEAACDASAQTAPRCAAYYDDRCLAGLCQPAPGLGEPCAAGDRCRPFWAAYCDIGRARCQMRHAEWEACDAAEVAPGETPCALSLTCDVASGVCAPLGVAPLGPLCPSE